MEQGFPFRTDRATIGNMSPEFGCTITSSPKGTYLLGVRAVIAESFERIHRINLVDMGVYGKAV